MNPFFNPGSETGETRELQTQREVGAREVDPVLDAPVCGGPEMSYCPREHGEWEGERGNSTWVPEGDYVPGKCNPEGSTWTEVLGQYGIDGIPFTDGEPNFGDVARGEVVLDEAYTDRGMVFNEADCKEAERRGVEPWEVTVWRQENGYTWHEKTDGRTCQKVPSVVHANVSHMGGHSNNVKNQL